MPQLTQAIPPRAFEYIRDRIASILIDEISNQVTLGYLPDIDANIFLERFITIDKTEFPAINICYAGSKFENKKATSSVGLHTYNIDVYANAASEYGEEGDSKAAILLQKLIGIVWSILENPAYRSLGFTVPFVTSVLISDINIIDPASQIQEATSSTFGRIQLTVTATEVLELKEPTLLAGYDTVINLGEGNAGYSWTGNE